MLRTGVTHHFDVYFGVCYTRVIMLGSADVSGWWAADARAERTGARPSSAVVERRHRRLELTFTIVRFLTGIKRESCPTQDEPEGRACFQYKMSLRDKAC
jgi:hypothetical protein